MNDRFSTPSPIGTKRATTQPAWLKPLVASSFVLSVLLLLLMARFQPMSQNPVVAPTVPLDAQNSAPSDQIADAITAVRSTVSLDDWHARTINKRTMNDFSAAKLDGGVAVINPLDWAYWVEDGHVYAANGLAMSASPGLPTAPVGIGYSEVQLAVLGTE